MNGDIVAWFEIGWQTRTSANHKIQYEGKDFSKRISYLDTEGDLVMNNTAGCAIWEIDLNDGGGIIEERYFDADSNLISKSTR
jgi:hypothetical protein